MTNLIKINDAAKILDISRSKTYQLAKSKKIPVIIIDGSIRVPKDKLYDWIEKNTIYYDK